MSESISVQDLKPENSTESLLTDSSSSETWYSSTSDTESETISDSETKTDNFDSLIPPFIREYCDFPKTAELRVSYDAPTNQSTYNYSITWDIETIESERLCAGNTENNDFHSVTSPFDSKTKNVQTASSGVKRVNDNETDVSSSVSSGNTSFESVYSIDSTISKPFFKLTYPVDNENINVKLVIVKPAEQYGMIYTYANIKTISSEIIIKPITKMLLRKKRNDVKYLDAGTLYYAEIQPDSERKMYIIEKEDYNNLTFMKIPKIYDSVVFVLDLGRYVENGTQIYFK